jgi:hypothetical protein
MKRTGSSSGSRGGRRIGENESRRDMGCTFQRVVGMEDSRVTGSRASSTVGEKELVSHFEMLACETVFTEAGKTVDVSHHAGRPTKDLKETAKKLLGPTADLVDGTDMFENLFCSAAVAEPKEFGSPKKFSILADRPASTGSLADKGMEVTFALSAAAGTESNRAQPGAVHGEVESANTLGSEKGKSNLGSFRIIGWHWNPTHASTGPVGL